jgi:hypothetical protein
VEWDESRGRIGDQHSISLRVDINLARHKVLRVLIHRFVSDQSVHFPYFLLLLSYANFSLFESLLQLLLLGLVELSLMLLSFFEFRSFRFLLVGSGPQPR